VLAAGELVTRLASDRWRRAAAPFRAGERAGDPERTRAGDREAQSPLYACSPVNHRLPE
jgi:hypothetical protein